jgi:hypothetical protein
VRGSSDHLVGTCGQRTRAVRRRVARAAVGPAGGVNLWSAQWRRELGDSSCLHNNEGDARRGRSAFRSKENMVLQIDENMPALPTVVNFCSFERKRIRKTSMLLTRIPYSYDEQPAFRNTRVQHGDTGRHISRHDSLTGRHVNSRGFCLQRCATAARQTKTFARALNA